MTDHAMAPAVDVRFGGGLTEADRPKVDQATRRLVTRLRQHGPRRVDAEVSVKDRDGRDMRTTLELWLDGLPRMVSTSGHSDLAIALGEVCERMITQLNETTTRREPKNNRTRRDSIRAGGSATDQGV